MSDDGADVVESAEEILRASRHVFAFGALEFKGVHGQTWRTGPGKAVIVPLNEDGRL